MYRIDNATAAAVMPVVGAVGPNPNGYFTVGSPVGGVPATVVDADWLNTVQEELAYPITQAGLTLNKTDRTQLYQSIIALIGSNDVNPVINGSCIVGQLTGQRPQANLSTSMQYAGVDRWAAAATGGAVSAGTIQQEATSLVGVSGFALSQLGVTLTGSGAVSARYRIESKDVTKYKNIAAFIADLIVYQDTGAPINYTITINKANASDNFSAETQIGTSGNISVANVTAQRISFSVAPGDCSNGVEIMVTANCGAVTTKNFRFTALQLRAGSVLRGFQQNRYADAAVACLRYFQWAGGAGASGFVATTTAISVALAYTPMRAAPTFTGQTAAYSAGVANTTVTSAASTPALVVATINGVQFNIGSFSGLTAGNGAVLKTANAAALDAEL